MDLLETVLRAANAESYLDRLTNNNIDVSVLPSLSDEDLQTMGVDDEAVRERILDKAKRLHVPHEKMTTPTVTDEDVQAMLNQMISQLRLHYLSLACALKRDDVVVCDVKLNGATKCLLKCLSSFEARLKQFEPKEKSKRRRTAAKTVLLLSSSALILLIGKVLFLK